MKLMAVKYNKPRREITFRTILTQDIEHSEYVFHGYPEEETAGRRWLIRKYTRPMFTVPPLGEIIIA